MRVGQAARYAGMSVRGITKAAEDGRLPCTMSAAGQRHFSVEDLDAFLGRARRERTEALYCRVDDHPENDHPENDHPENDHPENDHPENDHPENDCRQHQAAPGMTLDAQEAELRATSTGHVIAVYSDHAPATRENRPGLTALLDDAHAGKFTVVRTTHPDRLAQLGLGWLERLLDAYGVTLETLHPGHDPIDR